MTYWVGAVLLIAFGLVAGMSIGAPFLVVGLAMLALGPARKRPLVYWPSMIAIIAFIAGYLLVAPLTCRSTTTPGAASRTECSSIAGIRYTGDGSYNPPLTPAVSAGLVSAGASASVVLAILLTRSRRTPARPE